MKAVLGLVWFRRIWAQVPGERADAPQKRSADDLTPHLRRDIGLR